jgi:ketosteroid isomerase-like protein
MLTEVILVTIDETLEVFRAAAGAIARGDPEPVKAVYSHVDDVTLANPFGHAVRGRQSVCDALDVVASRFSDGEVTGFSELARYESADLVTLLGTEHWRTRVGDADLADFVLRVSSTYRNEDGDWKLVHRHADPISTFDADGPARRTIS